MTEDKQKIAIAEACGWTIAPNCKNADRPNEINVSKPLFIEGSRMGQTIGILPDYTQDLNAMHEAEKVFLKPESSAYVCYLYYRILELGEGILDWQKLAYATAAQRAEAFLKTIGKWEDEK